MFISVVKLKKGMIACGLSQIIDFLAHSILSTIINFIRPYVTVTSPMLKPLQYSPKPCNCSIRKPHNAKNTISISYFIAYRNSLINHLPVRDDDGRLGKERERPLK